MNAKSCKIFLTCFYSISLVVILGVLLNCSGSSTTQTTTTSIEASNPFLGANFYVDPNSNAAQQIEAWQVTRSEDADLLDAIASQPSAKWFGDWNSDIITAVSDAVDEIAAADALPVFVVYNIPNRDCGGYSAGGSEDAAAYTEWIANFADALGSQAAIIILEPDALALTTCLSEADATIRYQLMNTAVETFKSLPEVAVYLDAGHADWIDAAEMADRLLSAGVESADGFALNVSNFYTNAENISYGESISDLIGDKHFIIDTSRNGAGSNGEWCNPEDRALGENPTTDTGNERVDAFFWIKPPGESDGDCNGGPSAGTWWAEYALELVQNRN